MFFLQVAIGRLMGKESKIHAAHKRAQKKRRNRKKSSGTKVNSKKKKTIKGKTIIHKNSPENGQLLNKNGVESSANHVVHPTVVRANIPFKKKVNEVKKAATKARRVVTRSQLGRPSKKEGLTTSSSSKKQSEEIVAPSVPEELIEGSPAPVVELSTAVATSAPPKTVPLQQKQKNFSSRFSIISFRPFRPKPVSPEKVKTKNYEKKSGRVSSRRRSKSKSGKRLRSRSPDKKRKTSLSEVQVLESQETSKASSSALKRLSSQEDRKKKKSKLKIPLEKALKVANTDKQKKHKTKSKNMQRHSKLGEGNWLINKFLEDEEKVGKPILDGSLAGSISESLNSFSRMTGETPLNGSPIVSRGPRNESMRALLNAPSHSSHFKGIVNEAFIASPRNTRTHSSLKVPKTKDSTTIDIQLMPGKYRRSISAGAASNGIHKSALPSNYEKRKRGLREERSSEKRRRFSSPEKAAAMKTSLMLITPNNKEKSRKQVNCTPPPLHDNLHHQYRSFRSLSSPTPSASQISHASCASVPDNVREKLSLITSSPEGSVRSAVIAENNRQRLAKNKVTKDPLDWV